MRKLLLAVLVAVGCGGDPTAPSESLAGKWSASQVDAWHNVSLAVTESGGGLSGSWSGRLGAGGSLRYGTLSGSRSGDVATITLNPDASLACGYGYVVTLNRDGGAWQGTAKAVLCNGGQGAYAAAVSLSR